MNAITYKEVFPLIKDNRVWLGATSFNTGMYFQVPDSFVYSETYKFDRERSGKKVSRVPDVCWFTNLDHGRRHEPLSLMTEADNIKFSKRKQVKGIGYKKYDNYDAIEVPFVETIPSDYKGVMGVPISFLNKHNPDQFRIVNANDYKTNPKIRDKTHGLIKDKDGTINGKPTYARILIKHTKPAQQKKFMACTKTQKSHKKSSAT